MRHSTVIIQLFFRSVLFLNSLNSYFLYFSCHFKASITAGIFQDNGVSLFVDEAHLDARGHAFFYSSSHKSRNG